MNTNFSEQGEALHTELTGSLAVFKERCYHQADFLKNEFFTKITTLTKNDVISEEEAARLRQACEDRVRNVFVLYESV